MKKRKLLLALSIIPLVACNSLKAPKFSNYHNEVSYDDFATALNESNLSTFFDFSQSMTGKSYIGVQSKKLTKLDSLTLNETDDISQLNYTFKIDSVNNRSIATLKGESNGEGHGASGKSQQVSKISTARQYQFSVVDEKTQLVIIDKAQQVYYLSDAQDVGTVAASSALYYLVECLSNLSIYPNMDEKMKEAFIFYVDGNVYTFKYELTTESEDEVAKFSTTYHNLFQIELSENKLQYRYSLTSEDHCEYLQFATGHVKGEVYTSSYTLYSTGEIKLGKTTIDEIDISNYAFRNQDLGGSEN